MPGPDVSQQAIRPAVEFPQTPGRERRPGEWWLRSVLVLLDDTTPFCICMETEKVTHTKYVVNFGVSIPWHAGAAHGLKKAPGDQIGLIALGPLPPQRGFGTKAF